MGVNWQKEPGNYQLEIKGNINTPEIKEFLKKHNLVMEEIKDKCLIIIYEK